MAPVHYLRHIGLEVPAKQLALAFYQTYGITEDFSTRRERRINVRAYRFAVHRFIPRIAYALTLLHRHHEPAEPATPETLELESEVDAMAKENNWDEYRRKAGIGTYTLAGFLFVLPKVGPLSLVAVKGPTEATVIEYAHSVSVSVSVLRRMLARFTPKEKRPTQADGPAGVVQARALPVESNAQQSAGDVIPLTSRDPLHPLPNRDLDTGRVVQPGGYPLTDSTFAGLLHRLVLQPATPIPPGIKSDIQTYYANLDLPISTKKDPAQWAQVQADLKTLGAMPTSVAPEPYPTYGDDANATQEK
jgi:hypothetical protein